MVLSFLERNVKSHKNLKCVVVSIWIRDNACVVGQEANGDISEDKRLVMSD